MANIRMQADEPKRHALCKEIEHNARLFGSPLMRALAVKKNGHDVRDDLRSTVSRQGFAFLSGAERNHGALQAFARIGEVVAVRGQSTQQLRPRRVEDAPCNIYSGNFGLGEFPLHSDLAHWYIPPRYLALRCIKGAAGVNTLLFDTTLMSKALGRSVLRRTLAHPRRPLSGKLPLLRILEEPDKHASLIRWDSLFIKPATDDSAKTFRDIRAVLSEAPVIRQRLCAPGDMLIIDNWRMLHGRSAVTPSGLSRHIVRAYLGSLL
jgi:L-asparagine oxygenase